MSEIKTSLKATVHKWNTQISAPRLSYARLENAIAKYAYLIDGESQPPDEKDYNAINLRLLKAWQRHGNLGTIDVETLKDSTVTMFSKLPENHAIHDATLKDAAVTLFSAPPKNHAIADRTPLFARAGFPQQWQAAVDAVALSSRRWAIYRAFIYQYFRLYPCGDASQFREMRRIISHAMEQGDRRLFHRLARYEKHGLFANGVHSTLAEQIFVGRQKWPMLGINKPEYECPGLVRETFAIIRGQVSELLRQVRLSDEQLKHFCGLVDTNHGKIEDSYFLARAAEALLLPFHANKGMRAHSDAIRAYLLRKLGDPRVNKASWHAVDERARKVMESWLTRATVEAFLDLFERYADEDVDGQGRQCKERADFWWDYTDDIDEAWLLLGKQAGTRLKSSVSKDFRFGDATGEKPTQVMLLMRIGKAIIFEGSHKTAVRVWEAKDPHPKLYENTYDIEQDIFDGNHSAWQRHTGAWQPKVAELIRRYCGKKI